MNTQPEGPHGLALNLATLMVGVALGAAATLLLVSRSGPGLPAPVRRDAGDWRELAAESLARGREQVISAVEQSQTRTAGSYPAEAKSVRWS